MLQNFCPMHFFCRTLSFSVKSISMFKNILKNVLKTLSKFFSKSSFLRVEFPKFTPSRKMNEISSFLSHFVGNIMQSIMYYAYLDFHELDQVVPFHMERLMYVNVICFELIPFEICRISDTLMYSKQDKCKVHVFLEPYNSANYTYDK